LTPKPVQPRYENAYDEQGSRTVIRDNVVQIGSTVHYDYDAGTVDAEFSRKIRKSSRKIASDLSFGSINSDQVRIIGVWLRSGTADGERPTTSSASGVPT